MRAWGPGWVISLERVPGYAWSAVQSLLLRVVRSSLWETVTEVARAVAAGDAEQRWTSLLTGDPYGPPTLLRRLEVTVVS